MLDPNMIISIVGSSLGLLVFCIGLAGKSTTVPWTRQHLLRVDKQKQSLRHKLNKAEVEIEVISGIKTQGVCSLREDTRRLIRHSRGEIQDFNRFYKKFNESRTVRNWHYVAISSGSNKIFKYSKRFETYSDWITIARLSISLTQTLERSPLDDSSITSSTWKDVHRLRDELVRVIKAKREHPGRLKNLHVRKGIDLERLEAYAEGLVSRFGTSDISTTTSTLIVDDLPERCWQHYAPSVPLRHEETQAHDPEPYGHSAIGHNGFLSHGYDHVYDGEPQAPPKTAPSTHSRTSRSRWEPEKGRDEWPSTRGQNKPRAKHRGVSGGRASRVESRYRDGDKGIPALAAHSMRRPRERRHHTMGPLVLTGSQTPVVEKSALGPAPLIHIMRSEPPSTSHEAESRIGDVVRRSNNVEVRLHGEAITQDPDNPPVTLRFESHTLADTTSPILRHGHNHQDPVIATVQLVSSKSILQHLIPTPGQAVSTLNASADFFRNTPRSSPRSEQGRSPETTHCTRQIREEDQESGRTE
ncbi:hypothetical protein GGR57DRAFT_500933 [Xylariaceae sp. FL1272]|nr:hypothetical protein GGR57DRAFT_500933 [Xylariaceae sp. FL1272]